MQQSRKQIVLEDVNGKLGDLIAGMPNEVNLKAMIADDPYANETG